MPTSTELLRSDVARSSPATDAPVAEAARGLLSFGHQLISRNPQLLDRGNVGLSPASIGAAFAMARAGARGETAAQIDAALHFPTNHLGDAYNALTRDLTAPPDGEDAAELSVANAVLAQRDFRIEPAYLDALGRDFGAGVQTVDFRSGGAPAAINQWVRRETRDRISKLFDDFHPETRLVLANAVYLKATWEDQFTSYRTRPGPFRRAGGAVVTAQLMRTEDSERFEYAVTDDWAAVRLPYVGGQLAMWVLLPAARDGDPVALLEPSVLAAAAERARPQRVELALPKWDFQSDLPLNEPLQTLGVTAPFSAEADFSGISPAPLQIDQVIHRADITVDEQGTVAAAATGIAIRATSATVPDVAMVVDHPFAFAVLHEPSGAPVFEGVVGDPTAKR